MLNVVVVLCGVRRLGDIVADIGRIASKHFVKFTVNSTTPATNSSTTTSNSSTSNSDCSLVKAATPPSPIAAATADNHHLSLTVSSIVESNNNNNNNSKKERDGDHANKATIVAANCNMNHVTGHFRRTNDESNNVNDVEEMETQEGNNEITKITIGS